MKRLPKKRIFLYISVRLSLGAIRNLQASPGAFPAFFEGPDFLATYELRDDCLKAGLPGPASPGMHAAECTADIPRFRTKMIHPGLNHRLRARPGSIEQPRPQPLRQQWRHWKGHNRQSTVHRAPGIR